MGDYYNRSRSPLSLTLHGGRSISVAPKSWVTLTTDEEGSADLASKIVIGDLVPSKLNGRAVQEVAVAPVEAPVAPLRSALVRLPEEPAQEPAQEPTSVLDEEASPPLSEPISETRKTRKGRN